MTGRSEPDGSKREAWSLARQLLALIALAIIAAGVVLLIVADGRSWVILAAMCAFLVGVVLGMLVLVIELK